MLLTNISHIAHYCTLWDVQFSQSVRWNVLSSQGWYREVTQIKKQMVTNNNGDDYYILTGF